MLELLQKVFFGKNKDMFIVQLGSALLLTSFGIATGGVAGVVLGFLLRGFLGVFVEKGIFVIDLTLDSLREGAKLKEFEKAATEAYNKATAKVYNEDEKQAIRKQYLEIISRIGTVGNGPRS